MFDERGFYSVAVLLLYKGEKFKIFASWKTRFIIYEKSENVRV